MERLFQVLILVYAASAMVPWALLAQTPLTPPEPPGSLVPPALPSPPKSKNPIETLRQLLSMNPEQRANWLSQKSETARKVIQEKVTELESMTPTERELRLRLLQLRFYVLPLMQLTPEQRVGRMEEIPAEDRAVVAEKLKEWDLVPEDQQKELLQNEASLRRLPFFPSSRTEFSSKTNSVLSSNPAQEADLMRWQSYPPAKQERILKHFEQFFELKPEHRQRALRTLPTTDRARLEKNLSRFADLPIEERTKCVEAYERFMKMGNEERKVFLDNAVRWEAMTTEERRVWRLLTSQLPPSPPGLPGGIPMPPAPPTGKPAHQGVVTNVQIGR